MTIATTSTAYVSTWAFVAAARELGVSFYRAKGRWRARSLAGGELPSEIKAHLAAITADDDPTLIDDLRDLLDCEEHLEHRSWDREMAEGWHRHATELLRRAGLLYGDDSWPPELDGAQLRAYTARSLVGAWRACVSAHAVATAAIREKEEITP